MRITKILTSDNATVDQEADVHVLVVDLKHVTYREEEVSQIENQHKVNFCTELLYHSDNNPHLTFLTVKGSNAREAAAFRYLKLS